MISSHRLSLLSFHSFNLKFGSFYFVLFSCLFVGVTKLCQAILHLGAWRQQCSLVLWLSLCVTACSPPSVRPKYASGKGWPQEAKSILKELCLTDSLICVKAIWFQLLVIVTEKRREKGQSKKAKVCNKKSMMRYSTVRADCVFILFSPEIAESRVMPRTWGGFISCDFSSPASSWRQLQLSESFTHQDSASEVHTLRSWYLGFRLWISLWRHSAVKTPRCRTKPAAERLYSPSQATARAAVMEQATMHMAAAFEVVRARMKWDTKVTMLWF